MEELPAFLASFVEIQELKTEDDEVASLSCHKLGNLVVTSGRIIACDPYYCAETEPFDAAPIPPGQYPVIVCVAHLRNGNQRVALAVLQISDTVPVNWANALPVGYDVTRGRRYHYCVDSGIGCFMDIDAVSAFAQVCEDYDEETDPILEAMEKNRSLSSSWAYACVNQDTGANIIAFSSGCGDGGYPSYFGYDQDENIICLITDFGLLDHA